MSTPRSVKKAHKKKRKNKSQNNLIIVVYFYINPTPEDRSGRICRDIEKGFIFFIFILNISRLSDCLVSRRH